MFNWLPTLGSIILLDLVLSGDNALVIGAVAAAIPPKLRWVALLAGGGGTIVLRILLTYSVTLLLKIPYLQIIGGGLLLVITIKLLIEQVDTNNVKENGKKKTFWQYIKKDHVVGAILTILIADATMSLDNILAIAALAKEQTLLLVIGLFISIVLLLVGSALITFLMERLPWLILLAALVLIATAAHMVTLDQDVWSFLPNESAWWPPVVYILAFGITFCVSGYFWLRNNDLSGLVNSWYARRSKS